MVYKGISTIQKNREKKNYTQPPLRYCKKRYKQDSTRIQMDFLRIKSSLYYRELDKMAANITLEADTNIESIHKEIESTVCEVEEDGDVSSEQTMS